MVRWGNSTGINAGIMLLTPDTSELEGMIDEISDDTHPEHCYCNGPEQDYLSRYYPQWRHISCRLANSSLGLRMPAFQQVQFPITPFIFSLHGQPFLYEH